MSDSRATPLTGLWFASHGCYARAAMAEKEHALAQMRLLEAASDTFSERGFEGASLRAIATRAGVSFQLIKHYFGNKQDLWEAAVEYLYARYVETSELLEFDLSGDLHEQFRAHLELMMTETLQRAQLRQIVMLEFFANSHRYKNFLRPRSQAFFESRLLPYYEQARRLGVIKTCSGAEAALLWTGIVTNNLVAPDFVEFFLKRPTLSRESTDTQVDLAFRLLTGDSSRQSDGQGTSLDLQDEGPASDLGSQHGNVFYPRRFGVETSRTEQTMTENRRLKQLVGELTLENRLLTERLKRERAQKKNDQESLDSRLPDGN